MRFAISLALTLLAAPALAGAPKVMTDLPAVHSLVAQVMGDLGQPTLLLDKGANAHSFQLRPSQAAALAEADLVIRIGAGMTPWLDRAAAGIGLKGEMLSLLDAPGTFTRSYGASDAHDHGNHSHGADEHAEGEIDPHAWLDPLNAQHWLGVIAAGLTQIDPENGGIYASNAAAAAARIATLDMALADRLADAKGKPFVVFHDAYGYFTDHYGLTVAGSVALGDAARPGAARLAEIRQTLTQHGALCIFPETQHDPKLVETVIEGTGTRLGTALDPEGSSLTPGPALYEALLTQLAESVANCLR